VLLAVAALFALALQAAVLSRAGTIESRVIVERARQELDARAAAAMVLQGLRTTAEQFAAQTGAAQAAASPPPPAGGGDEEERPRIELPAIIKEMLGDKAQEIEKEAEGSLGPPVEGGGVTGRLGQGNRRPPRVWVRALPAEPVRVRLAPDGPEYAVTLRDISAAININLAERDELMRYFDAMDVPFERATAVTSQILDWRDEDSFAEPFGAEQDAYRARGVTCRDAPFESLEELLYLPAMDRPLFDLVRADLTTAGDGKVHVGSASPAVLRSLPGMDAESTDALLRARRESRVQEKDLERVLPIYAQAAATRLRATAGGVLRVRVETEGDVRAAFEGIAVLGPRGIAALGLRPIL
jgi:hypothetical protein